MKITEWFARAVSAGLVPEWGDIIADYFPSSKEWHIGSLEKNLSFIIPNIETIKQGDRNTIQLRKDGKDLYSLEWRKPTENDIGKKTWMLACDGTLLLQTITEISISRGQLKAFPCLLADHGQICPDVESFRKVYDEE